MPNNPLTPPLLRPDLPNYGAQVQWVRVPPGGASSISSSGAASLLAHSFVQQYNTTLGFRDREPCWLFDPNGVAVPPGRYLCRLVGNYLGLPLFAAVVASGGGSGGASGSIATNYNIAPGPNYIELFSQEISTLQAGFFDPFTAYLTAASTTVNFNIGTTYNFLDIAVDSGSGDKYLSLASTNVGNAITTSPKFWAKFTGTPQDAVYFVVPNAGLVCRGFLSNEDQTIRGIKTLQQSIAISTFWSALRYDGVVRISFGLFNGVTPGIFCNAGILLQAQYDPTHTLIATTDGFSHTFNLSTTDLDMSSNPIIPAFTISYGASFTTVVGQTGTDPIGNVFYGGIVTSIATGPLSIDLTSQVTGLLPLGNGGSGADLSATGPGVVVQISMGSALGIVTFTSSGDYFGGDGAFHTLIIDLGSMVTGILPLANGGSGVDLSGSSVGVLIQATPGGVFTAVPLLPESNGGTNAGSTDLGSYAASSPGDWNGTAPTTIREALDRCAALLFTLNGGTGP